MAEPTTQAGRALLEWWQGHRSILPPEQTFAERIAAIEAEARAEVIRERDVIAEDEQACAELVEQADATIAALREALKQVAATVYSDDTPLDSPSYSELHLRAVGIARAALREQP